MSRPSASCAYVLPPSTAARSAARYCSSARRFASVARSMRARCCRSVVDNVDQTGFVTRGALGPLAGNMPGVHQRVVLAHLDSPSRRHTSRGVPVAPARHHRAVETFMLSTSTRYAVEGERATHSPPMAGATGRAPCTRLSVWGRPREDLSLVQSSMQRVAPSALQRRAARPVRPGSKQRESVRP